MRRLLCLVLYVLLVHGLCFAGGPEVRVPPIRNPLYFGIEQDVLPYILKGYIGTGWMGVEKMRVRFSYAQATQPKFFLQDDIVRDRVQAFGISTEFYFRGGFQGWWIGPGIGYWTDVVDTRLAKGFHHESAIFSLGGGYSYDILPWLYVSSWTALHARVSGNYPVDYGGITYRPSVLTPEVSLKIGVKFHQRIYPRNDI